jgi:hypothetical protein
MDKIEEYLEKAKGRFDYAHDFVGASEGTTCAMLEAIYYQNQAIIELLKKEQ